MSDLLPGREATFKPFSKDFDTQFCYESRVHQEAMARLQLMIEHHYLGVLTGEVGSGKSTLIRKLFAGLDTMRYQSIYLSKAKLTPRDFYSAILGYMGIEAPFSVTKARNLWEETLQTRIAGADRTFVLVIDEAQELSEAMMLELRFVLSYNMDSSALFPLILVGQPELRKQLRLKKYEATIQRIGLQYHLGGMTKEETYAYIRHHMKASQSDPPVFADSAMQRIHTVSQCIPRITNQICTQALLEATSKSTEVIEESHIARILTDLERQRGGTT
jgi:type II secretory pathway predicted ATPase ExeA